MNSASVQAGFDGDKKGGNPWVWALFALAVCFVTMLPKPQRNAAALVTLLCPFAWFYLNELDISVISKPDLYDNQDAVRMYVRNNPHSQIAAFPAFAIWQRKNGAIQQ